MRSIQILTSVYEQCDQFGELDLCRIFMRFRLQHNVRVSRAHGRASAYAMCAHRLFNLGQRKESEYLEEFFHFGIGCISKMLEREHVLSLFTARGH